MKAFLKRIFLFIPRLWRYLKVRLGLKKKNRVNRKLIKYFDKLSVKCRRCGGSLDFYNEGHDTPHRKDGGDK